MATRDDIKTWLTANIPTQLAAFTEPSAPQAYAGQRERVNPADFDVRIRYLNPVDVQRETGLRRHLVEVILKIIGHDESEENNLADELEGAADALITAYDGQTATVAAGLTSSSIERVRAFRHEPLDIDHSRATAQRSAVVRLQIDEWRT